MAYRWEPRWIRKRFEVDGVVIETCVDTTTGMIVCPICVDVESLCPYEDKPSIALPRGNPTYFFSINDLLLHIKAHRESLWKKRVEEEEEAEEEFVESEQEE